MSNTMQKKLNEGKYVVGPFVKLSSLSWLKLWENRLTM